jgi:Asp-tRNA(Asn)/Glu-tRNA(Gln) amidotransferase B subunit
MLDERLMRIHAMWKSPPTAVLKFADGVRLTSLSCFKANGMLPLYQKQRFRDEYKLPQEDIDWWFIADKGVEGHVFSWPFFDMLYERCFGVRIFPLVTSKIVVQHLASKFANREELIDFLVAIDADDFSRFIMECGRYDYSWKYIQKTLDTFMDTGDKLVKITTDNPYVVVSDENELETICDKVIAENQKSVNDYKKGKFNSINHLKGQVMKATNGKANPVIVNKILERKLSV